MNTINISLMGILTFGLLSCSVPDSRPGDRTPQLPGRVQETMPSHVHLTLNAAVKGAASSGHAILAILVQDDEQRAGASDYLATPAGENVRSFCEVWLPSILDVEAIALAEKHAGGVRPSVVRLDNDGRGFQGVVAGIQATPIKRALRIFMEARYEVRPDNQFVLIPGPWEEDPKTRRMRIQVQISNAAPSEEEIHEWAGRSVDPKPFLLYHQARQKDITCAKEEPHRSWLMNLLLTGSPTIKAWAATRLLEAHAKVKSEDVDPWPTFINYQAEDLVAWMKYSSVHPVHRKTPEGLGGTGDIAEHSPFWGSLDGLLRKPGGTAISFGLYALLHDRLKATDRDWLFEAVTAASSKAPGLSPWDSSAFWLAADWLVLFAQPDDWNDFLRALPPDWKSEASSLKAALDRIPAYAMGAGPLSELVAHHTAVPEEIRKRTHDEVIKANESLLAGWNITAEGLSKAHFGNLRVEYRGKPPKVPLAASRKIGARVIVNLLIDPSGNVRAARPEPTYGLGIFAPAALQRACSAHYRVTTSEDDGKPWTFVLFLTFEPAP